MAGPLKKAQHERFTQLVASGIKPMDAYVSVGYSKGGAAQAANNLLKRTDVRSRLEEIQRATADAVSANVAFDKDRVMMRLNKLSHQAEERGQISAAIRAEELIGKERGMFVERAIQTIWDGSLERLTADQLARLTQTFEQIAAEQAQLPAPEEPKTVQ